MTVELTAAASSTQAIEPSADASLRHVLQRIGLIESRVRLEVARRRRVRGEDEDDPYRGLYVPDERVDELLAGHLATPVAVDPPAAARIERAADVAATAGAELRLRRLAATVGLDELDTELLLVAMAPSVDRRFEQLYGYLNDDVSLRWATVGLALDLCGLPTASGRARARLTHAGALVRHGLVTVADVGRSELTRSLHVEDRVSAHLLGGDEPSRRLRPYLLAPRPAVGAPTEQLVQAMTNGAGLVHLRDRTAAGGLTVAATAVAELGRDAVVVELDRLADGDDAAGVVSDALLEAELQDAVLVIGPIERSEEVQAGTVAAMCRAAVPTVLVGRAPWDPHWSDRVPVAVELPRLDPAVAAGRWGTLLGPDAAMAARAERVSTSMRLGLEQIDRAATAAQAQAAAAGRTVDEADLLHGARSQSASGLERLARRIEPTLGWDTLVVPPDIEAELRAIGSRWRHRDRVLGDYGLGGGQLRGRGVSALFAGGSGTGKTLSAEVVAGELGLDLYIVNLSTVVDKYIGETSKNLERIFDEADRVNGVLLFDEADALFGKRSAVSDAKDRHANVEVAYLLQRMESFDGVAILTTNLAANLDDAFLRRLDAIVDFPTPDAEVRAELWRTMFARGVPCADDVHVTDLAERFELSGSEIRNIVVSAAHAAVRRDREAPVTMEDVVRATIREHRKLGRHLTAAALGPHVGLLEPDR